MKKKFLSLLMAIIMVLSVSVAVYADEKSPPATRGEIVKTLLVAADAYQSGLNKEAIIQGSKNKDLRENEPAKKVEALVMLSRAFGELPEPVGNDLRSGTFGVKYTDVPTWAKKDIDNLTKAGVLTGNPDGKLGANDPITIDEFQNLIARIWTLKGSHLHDDFYEAINKKWLNRSTIPVGEIMGGGFPELQKQNTDKIEKIITELSGKQFAEGTKEQKIADFYSTALDTSNRNKQGIEPIQKYVKAIDDAKTLDDLVQADLTLEKELGLSSLFSFAIMNDAKNSSKNALYFTGLATGLDKNSFVSEDANAKKAYIQYMTKLLVVSGEKESAAIAFAEKIYEMEKALASVSLDPHEQGDVTKYYNPYSIEQFDNMFKTVDMKQVLKSMKVDSADKVIVFDVKLAQKGAELLTDTNLNVLKAYSKVQLLMATGGLLSDEFGDAANEFAATLYGVTGEKTDQEIAVAKTTSTMSGYLEQMYAEQHFSPKAKKDVEQMVDQLIATYEERIKSLDWMSETTKAKAIKKLDTMIVKIGYPDKWDTTLDKVAIKTYDEGGSLFSNTFTVTKAYIDNTKAKLDKPVDRTQWVTSVYTVNAFYNALNNEITFPAGILQAPFYDINAKPEENYGAIGMIIGHEISHAFDNNGSAYDENGNANNWWTEEDFKKFEEKNQKLIEFYNAIEIIPGVFNDGQLTLSENGADLGGMAASLQVVSQMSNPDYKAYFESNAEMWKSTTTKEFAAMLSKNDVHSANKVRVNRTIVNFQEFYDTYGIKPGDGMYIAPEDRVSIW
ncbi:M13-type metalloendopeptidase [Lysinibacillus fusiformis]|uniref:M13-type metalloendopeptidase n=1 Tax=Lysinibacillus fusiformis TaxID=28031 RepID=UPI000885EB7A|nr:MULTISPECIES: M13-type metalloendopeptidase [Lysinibacillus]MCG7435225.1 S-layer homology domain-containing protein [Lysinibacillus fusiformis]MED4670251.1 M13-type metalloendopeptidase [Lysinibacillus fusiformis]PCD82758.1 peptidase [Lysinibacillus fusiformis]QAS56191.1 peptidase [Lysinibacillus sphaericus]RDV36144.1 peptidase [Lysinibacillus fusiformis]